MANLKNFGEKVKARRLELNLTQDELARAVGYTSRSSINKLELGLIDPSQSKIAAIAQKLKVNPSYLVGWSNSANFGVNNGIIGNNNQNNNVSVANPLTPIQNAIVTVCSALDESQQAEILNFATNLLNNQNKGGIK